MAVVVREDSRLQAALDQPHRRHSPDPLDHRLECPLGRIFLQGAITEAEYNAGCRWRRIYYDWLMSIGAPSPFPAAIDLDSVTIAQAPLTDDFDNQRAERAAKAFKTGEKILRAKGVRVFHAVNAIAVYEEPEELGDWEYTLAAARRGFSALAEWIG